MLLMERLCDILAVENVLTPNNHQYAASLIYLLQIYNSRSIFS